MVCKAFNQMLFNEVKKCKNIENYNIHTGGKWERKASALRYNNSHGVSKYESFSRRGEKD
jgi:hypothetical protein